METEAVSVSQSAAKYTHITVCDVQLSPFNEGWLKAICDVPVDHAVNGRRVHALYTIMLKLIANCNDDRE